MEVLVALLTLLVSQWPRSLCFSNWPFLKTCKKCLGHREMKKQKNQLRPKGSSAKKNCPHLPNQPPGAQPVFSIPGSWDWQHAPQYRE